MRIWAFAVHFKAGISVVNSVMAAGIKSEQNSGVGRFFQIHSP